MKNSYYSPVQASTDCRKGMGYAKCTTSPGLGTTYAMGWDTGIYPPELPEVDYLDLPFDDEEDLKAFFAKVNLGYTSADSVRPRADMSSYTSSDRFAGFVAEQMQMHPMSGISPQLTSTSGRGLATGGSGRGMATGGSSSQFGSTRTRPGKVGGDGTQFGFSRMPLDTPDDGIRFMSLVKMLNMSPAERNFLKQQIKLKDTLTMVESLLCW